MVTSSENGDIRAVNLEVDRYCRDCCLTENVANVSELEHFELNRDWDDLHAAVGCAAYNFQKGAYRSVAFIEVCFGVGNVHYPFQQKEMHAVEFIFIFLGLVPCPTSVKCCATYQGVKSA